jgi:hypothetical protein
MYDCSKEFLKFYHQYNKYLILVIMTYQYIKLHSFMYLN